MWSCEIEARVGKATRMGPKREKEGRGETYFKLDNRVAGEEDGAEAERARANGCEHQALHRGVHNRPPCRQRVGC